MPLQATSGAASYDAFGGGVPVVPVFIEDVFSTYLFTGNGSTQTITNGIDLSTKGGLVWAKSRAAGNHFLYDTSRGVNKYLMSNATDSETTQTDSLTAFNTTGFSIGNALFNDNAVNYASWTFRKQPKFFDVVTYTGNGTAGRQIAHSLGSAPGMIIVKNTSTSGIDWQVYHRSLGNGQAIFLNLTNAAQAFGAWNYTDPTATNFTVSGSGEVNGSSQTYVAYLFAHDAGGFGLTGTDNVISCGSYTGTGAAGNNITLGYEPQWVMLKRTDSTGAWFMHDVMRGMPLTNSYYLTANTSSAETEGGIPIISPTATGFQMQTGIASWNASGGTYIYIAIRRGPMKVPTSGTSVFSPQIATSSGSASNTVTTNFPVDLAITQVRNGYFAELLDRLRGDSQSTYVRLRSASTAAEATGAFGLGFDNNTGYVDNYNWQNFGGGPFVYWNFKRAPSFFDEVCYTGGTGTPRVLNHNLAVPFELVITKIRNFAGEDWVVNYSNGSTIIGGYLNSTAAFSNSSTAPSTDITSLTSTTYTLNTSNRRVNGAYNYVAYLFATCAGVSKVGSYTGTGTTLQVDCGFTGGARFILIKRTDSTGDWYVWDTARGIVSGNDPYLLLNSTAAEVTSTDYIDTYSAGFELSSTAPAAINASGGTFIFLAIA